MFIVKNKLKIKEKNIKSKKIQKKKCEIGIPEPVSQSVLGYNPM